MASESMDDSAEPERRVTVEWADGQPVSVFIRQDWADDPDAAQLLGEVLDQASERYAANRSPSWQSRVRFDHLPLDQLREFSALVAEARAEANAQVTAPAEVRTRHLTSRWRADELMGIDGDLEWMGQATRQELADELLVVLTSPEPVEERTTSRDRLMQFLGGFQ